MNKKTLALTVEQYHDIIDTMITGSKSKLLCKNTTIRNNSTCNTQ